jgi:hypothetical protein
MAAIESTILMGLVLLGIVAAIGVLRDWERGPRSGDDRAASLVGLFRKPVTWTVLFVVFALLFVVGALAFVDGTNVLGIGPAMGELILVGGFGAVLVGFLFAGLYAAAKNRGMKGAQAAGASSIVLVFLFIAVVAVLLLTA